MVRNGVVFQFPSNGKAYPKSALRHWGITILITLSFNSPSNGKAYPKAGSIEDIWAIFSFNSLQTGKPIQSLSFFVHCVHIFWFPFPSNGKAYPKKSPGLPCNKPGVCFHSLQTGKPIQRFSALRNGAKKGDVFPFPFKRESLSKGPSRQANAHSIKWGFNSLQTGKPIQRESHYSVSLKEGNTCFNSLQTGKPIQSDIGVHSINTYYPKFQFPSNGKAYPKPASLMSVECSVHSFNSLQTGKPIQRVGFADAHLSVGKVCFNSLQTGKPIQSSKNSQENRSKEQRFNSLQTGKPIQRLKLTCPHTLVRPCFNSLQTGKPIQSSQKLSENLNLCR